MFRLWILAELLGVEPALDQAIDVHHNFCAVEEHDGERLWMHRKGAIAVPAGALAVIPGSMGTASYLVRGYPSRLRWRRMWGQAPPFCLPSTDREGRTGDLSPLVLAPTA
jgi:RNA-splicing ligase RtcB